MVDHKGDANMARPKNNPDFNRDRLESEVLKMVVDIYMSADNKNHEVSFVADALDMSDLKARKLLITAGERFGERYYESGIADEIRMLRIQGKTVKEIEKITGLSHASVIGYLPYSKTIYSMKEISADAERIRRFRKRQKLCADFRSFVAGEKMLSEIIEFGSEEDYLWSTLVSLSGCIFRTSGRGSRPGVRFKYEIRVVDGRVSGEMRIDRKEKTITKATVLMAYRKVKGKTIPGPKAIGAPGADSYLYPVFMRLGVITPDHKD